MHERLREQADAAVWEVEAVADSPDGRISRDARLITSLEAAIGIRVVNSDVLDKSLEHW